MRFFVRGDPYDALGPLRGRSAIYSGSATKGQIFLFGDRPPGPRSLLARALRHPHLAHDRPGRRLPQFRARPHDSAAASGYFGGTVTDEVIQRTDRYARLDPAAAAVDDAGRGRAEGLELDSDLLRHHDRAFDRRLGRAWRAPCAAGCCRCAKRTSRSRRASRA